MRKAIIVIGLIFIWTSAILLVSCSIPQTAEEACLEKAKEEATLDEFPTNSYKQDLYTTEDHNITIYKITFVNNDGDEWVGYFSYDHTNNTVEGDGGVR